MQHPSQHHSARSCAFRYNRVGASPERCHGCMLPLPAARQSRLNMTCAMAGERCCAAMPYAPGTRQPLSPVDPAPAVACCKKQQAGYSNGTVAHRAATTLAYFEERGSVTQVLSSNLNPEQGSGHTLTAFVSADRAAQSKPSATPAALKPKRWVIMGMTSTAPRCSSSRHSGHCGQAAHVAPRAFASGYTPGRQCPPAGSRVP
jgi:hypothetical protein